MTGRSRGLSGPFFISSQRVDGKKSGPVWPLFHQQSERRREEVGTCLWPVSSFVVVFVMIRKYRYMIFAHFFKCMYKHEYIKPSFTCVQRAVLQIDNAISYKKLNVFISFFFSISFHLFSSIIRKNKQEAISNNTMSQTKDRHSVASCEPCNKRFNNAKLYEEHKTTKGHVTKLLMLEVSFEHVFFFYVNNNLCIKMYELNYE